MVKTYAIYFFLIIVLLFPLWGNGQNSFVTFELIGPEGNVCQGKTLGIIATLTDEYQNYSNFEWGGDAKNYREIRNDIAIVNTETPGEKILQFTLNIDSLTKLDTTISISILPKPSVKLSRKGKNIIATEVKNEALVSYRWIYDGQVLPDESSNNLSNPKPGWYRVVVTNSNGCRATSDEIAVN